MTERLGTGPTWQRRVRQNVADAIERGDDVWARRYATFLRKQLARLDRAYGFVDTTPARARQAALATAVTIIVRANPDASLRAVARVVGRVPSAVRPYWTAARKRFAK